MIACLSQTLTFPESRIVLEKEVSDQLYFTTIWIIAKTIIILPQIILTTLLYTLITHWAINMNSEFHQQWFFLTTSAMGADSLGFLIGAISKTTLVARQLAPLFVIPFMLVGNYLVNINQIPIYLRWIAYISDWFYAFNSFAIAEFSPIKNYNNCGEIENGNDALDYYLSISKSDEFMDWFLCVILFVAFRAIAAFILVKRNGY